MVKLSCRSSCFEVITIRLRSFQNSSLRGLNTDISSGWRTCEVCAGKRATTISCSFNKFMVSKEILPAYSSNINKIILLSHQKCLVSFTKYCPQETNMLVSTPVTGQINKYFSRGINSAMFSYLLLARLQHFGSDPGRITSVVKNCIAPYIAGIKLRGHTSRGT